MGELLQKNIATFRCYGNISRAKYYVPPHPLKTFLTVFKNKFVTHRIDSRREHKVRFCCRKKSGATETLISRKVVGKQNRRPSVACICWNFVFINSFVAGRPGGRPLQRYKNGVANALFLCIYSCLWGFLFMRVLFGRGAGEPFFAKKFPPRSL